MRVSKKPIKYNNGFPVFSERLYIVYLREKFADGTQKRCGWYKTRDNAKRASVDIAGYIGEIESDVFEITDHSVPQDVERMPPPSPSTAGRACPFIFKPGTKEKKLEIYPNICFSIIQNIHGYFQLRYNDDLITTEKTEKSCIELAEKMLKEFGFSRARIEKEAKR